MRRAEVRQDWADEKSGIFEPLRVRSPVIPNVSTIAVLLRRGFRSLLGGNLRPIDREGSGSIGGDARADLFDNDLFDLPGKTFGDFHVF